MTRFAATFGAVLAALFPIPAFPSPAHAQAESARNLPGSVTDPSRAVIPNANVRLVDIDRGLQNQVATGNGGSYTFASVRPGHYLMEVEKSGFKVVR